MQPPTTSLTRSAGSAAPASEDAGPGDPRGPPDLEGRVVAGRYRVERLIGAGGMGLVFLAEHLVLRRPVALKLLHTGRQASEDAVKRALREAQALSAVEHESIVSVLDAGLADTGEAFIALELLEGWTLKQLLLESSFLPWRWAAKATSRILSALEAIHERGFVHRDVKPSNCFCVTAGRPLASEPRVKLIDFGIARLLDPAPEDLITADGQAIGTPAYVAPEQAGAARADARADVYSTGVTLYELLTGKLPAFAPRVGSTTFTESLRPPSAVNPGAGIPPSLDAIVLRALEPDPERRFPSARAMLDDLVALLNTEPAPAPSQTSSAAEDATFAGESARAPALRGRPPELTHVAALARLSAQEEVQLARLHAKVERFWISGVLHGSLETSMLAPQMRTLEDEWVAGPFSVLESAPPAAAPPVVVPPGRTVLDVFEESGRSLLLLGDPGTGKTTQLLLLAKALLDASPRPVPVVFTLATWTGAARSLHAWMAEELCARYQVPASFAERWLSGGQILPLLDGLDEAPSPRRAACVAAIDEAVERATLPGIVVTSRTEEYTLLSVRLRLNAALRQHRLSRETVAEVFASNPVLAALSGERRDQLLELAESPLALTLLTHVASITLQPGGVGSGSAEDQLPRLLDEYIDRMLTRSGKRRLPVDREKLIHVIEHLAASMSRNNCAVFQLDALQPGWLERRRGLWAYVLGSRLLAAGVFGGGLVLAYGLTPLENGGFRATLGFGALTAASTAVTAGLVCALGAAWTMRSPDRKRRTWYGQVLYAGSMSVAAGLLNGGLLGWWGHHPVAGVMGFEAGLVAAVLLCPHVAIGDVHADVRPREALRFSLSHALRAVPVALVLGAVGFAASSVERDSQASVTTMSFVMIIAILLGGLRGREVDEKATPTGGIRRSFRSGLVVSVVGGPLIATLVGSSYGIRYGLYSGLAFSLALWLWYGGYSVIQHWLLRALLRLERHDYCDQGYLDSAVDRALLHRVGGGCMFIHPLFAAHLAARYRSKRHDAS